MKEAFLSHDHILISKGFHDPIPHRHFAKHLIFSMNEEFECVVEDERFFKGNFQVIKTRRYICHMDESPILDAKCCNAERFLRKNEKKSWSFSFA